MNPNVNPNIYLYKTFSCFGRLYDREKVFLLSNMDSTRRYDQMTGTPIRYDVILTPGPDHPRPPIYATGS